MAEGRKGFGMGSRVWGGGGDGGGNNDIVLEIIPEKLNVNNVNKFAAPQKPTEVQNRTNATLNLGRKSRRIKTPLCVFLNPP